MIRRRDFERADRERGIQGLEEGLTRSGRKTAKKSEKTLSQTSNCGENGEEDAIWGGSLACSP